MRYFLRFDSDRQPINLYKFHQDIYGYSEMKKLSLDDLEDLVLEESWTSMGWEIVDGVIKRIIHGYIDCDEITEEEARRIFPEAFVP